MVKNWCLTNQNLISPDLSVDRDFIINVIETSGSIRRSTLLANISCKLCGGTMTVDFVNGKGWTTSNFYRHVKKKHAMG